MTPTKTLGPDLLAFLGEVLFSDLSKSTTVAEAAELARGYKAAVEALASLASKSNGFGSNHWRNAPRGWEFESIMGVHYGEVYIDLEDLRWDLFVDGCLVAEGCGTNGTTTILNGVKALFKELEGGNA